MISRTQINADTEKVEQANKRRRLDHDVLPSAGFEGQRASQDLLLEVDILVLDYLAYQATCAALASRSAAVQRSASLPLNLDMVDSFLAIFKARHADYKMDQELRFRMLLLKVVVLHTQRLTRNPTTPDRQALDQLRENNRIRAKHWLNAQVQPPSLAAADSLGPTRQADLEAHRAFVLHSLSVPAEDDAHGDAHYGTQGCVSLLDILPLFMQVSAARDEMNGSGDSMTRVFMTLAAEFMLQACLEQVFTYGTQAPQAAREAFAWGYDAVHPQDEWAAVNEMFRDPVSEQEVGEWRDVREAYHCLVAHRQEDGEVSSDVTRLNAVARDHPVEVFESEVFEFFIAMMQSIPKPMLVQLETGQIDGMSEKETQDFIEACDLGVAQFWEKPVG